MSRTPSAVFRTLRSGARNLLPRTSILLYGRDANGFRKTLDTLKRQLNTRMAVTLLLDDPHLDPDDTLPGKWPRSLPLHTLTTDIPCGKAKLLNLALEHLRGDYLLVLEAGDDPDLDLISSLEHKLSSTDDATIGAYGDLELWSQGPSPRLLRTCRGERSANRRRLAARLKQQTCIAPPLLELDTLRRIGGYPTDYPGEGRLLSDTALVLRLLESGNLAYVHDATIRRPCPNNRRLKQDESNLLNVLTRLSLKKRG